MQDPSLTVDLYALPYETIEERLVDWGIPRAVAVDIGPTRDAGGNWNRLEGVEEYETSLVGYLRERPRRGRSPDEVDTAAIRHDAVMIAWVQRLRYQRGISVPTLPSQVDTWFLTRDRKLTNWDLEYVNAHGLGSVARCLTLDDWLEGLSVLFPPFRENEAVGAMALRELAMTCPPLQREHGLSASDLEDVGRAAEVFRLHPNEAARVAADQRVVKGMRRATTTKSRLQAIKDGVVRLKDEEIDSLRAASVLHQTAAERAVDKARRMELEKQRLEAERTSIAELKRLIEPDAEFGRRQQLRGPLALGTVIILSLVVVAALARVPALWSAAVPSQRALIVVVACLLVFAAGLHIGGYGKKAARIMALFALILAIATGVVDLYTRFGDRSKPPGPVQPTADSLSQLRPKGHVQPLGKKS